MAARKSAGRPLGKKPSLTHNIEKDPLQTGRTDRETGLLRGLAVFKRWDIRHWSWPGVLLALGILIVGLIVLFELVGVRLLSPMFDEWIE